jgi:uncharacterized membrane protein YdbT with pleckstrin-like domain
MLADGEEVIWEGVPTWRAWGMKWILGWVLAPLVIGLFLVGSVWLQTRSRRWRLTTRRIEVEGGLLSRRVETIELWKVRDVELRQSLADRMFGVCSVLVTAHDQTTPAVEVRGLPGSRDVYDRLMAAVMNARQQRGVMNLNP